MVVFMEVKLLGGAGEVGRSGILLKGEKNILLDYGIKIDGKTEYPLAAGRVDAFVLSHAHLDHSGYAPALYHDSMPVSFGTEPTLRLAELLIEDSIKINRLKKARQRFTKNDLKRFVQRYVSYPYHAPIDFGGYRITLYDAGHIAGSSITLVEHMKSGKRIAYTGDFKLSPQTLHLGAEKVEADVLITESTYATREHPVREELVRLFVESVKEIVENGGTALIPAFAVGRSQEILSILYKNRLADRTYVDGMSKKATEIVLRHPDFSDGIDALLGAVRESTVISDPYERHGALEGGSVVVTTAGMLNGGPVLDYITRLNSKSMIFLTGYQAEDTNGRRLLDNKPIIVDKRNYFVKTPFAFYDLSAHAGQDDLYKYIKMVNPEKVLCVHGDAESTGSLKEQLELEGLEAYAPKMGESVKLGF